MITISPSLLDDFEEVLEIFRQVHKMHVGFAPHIYKDTKDVISFEEYKKSVDDKTFYVAKVDGKIKGILGYYINDIDFEGRVKRRVLFIHTIAVHEDSRKKGIGKAMMDFVFEKMKKDKIDNIELSVNVKNSDAIKFYEKLGFKTLSLKMER